MYKTIKIAVFAVGLGLLACTIYAQTSSPEKSRINSLPWDIYNPMTILRIDSLRSELKDHVATPDEFLYNSFNSQLDATTLDLYRTDSLLRYIMTAEACKHARNYLPPDNAMLFEAIGDKMLGKLTDTLSVGIQRGIFDTQDENISYLIRRLADDHYLINIRVSNLDKTLRYLQEGRYSYVFHKLTTTYKSEFIKFLGVIVLLIMLFFFRKKIWRFFRQKTYSKNN